MNPPSQLVLGYHWFAFLNEVRVSTIKKNSFKSVQIYRKDAQFSGTDFLVLEFFFVIFVRLLVFEI